MLIFKLKPVGKDYLWGGNRLNTDYNKNIDLTPLAETWEFSLHPNGLCTIDGGLFSGKTLQSVLQENPNFLGAPYNRTGNVPLLVKFIDAERDLSIQVHPNDEYALTKENQSGKSEMWYVLDAKPNSKLVYGFEHNMTKSLILDAYEKGTFAKNLHFEAVKPNDVFYIPAGTIHGIGKGILLVEIQQSSDLTYRLYDYDRVDKNGKKRELHIDKAIEVVNMSAFKGKTCNSKMIYFYPNYSMEELTVCKHFQVKKFVLKGSLQLDLSFDPFNIFLVTKGEGLFLNNNKTTNFYAGQCFFITYGQEALQISGDCEILKINC